jgi:hypothetical protein
VKLTICSGGGGGGGETPPPQNINKNWEIILKTWENCSKIGTKHYAKLTIKVYYSTNSSEMSHKGRCYQRSASDKSQRNCTYTSYKQFSSE